MENIDAFFKYALDFFLKQTEDVIKKKSYGPKGCKFYRIDNIDSYYVTSYEPIIVNKFFSLNKDDRIKYARLLLDRIDFHFSNRLWEGEKISIPIYITIDGRTNIMKQSYDYVEGYAEGKEHVELHKKKDGYNFDVHSLSSDVDYFIIQVLRTILLFVDNSEVKEMIKDRNSEVEYDELICIAKGNGEISSKGSEGRKEKSTSYQSDLIFRALLASIGWKQENSTKLACFESWLFGGSVDSIRQSVISQGPYKRSRGKIESDNKVVEEKLKLLGVTYKDGRILIEK